MDGVGKLFHHATGKYGMGHTIVKVCLYYRGVTIPWASLLYVKKEHAEGLGTEFFKLTKLAGQAIRQATLPDHFKVTVLFDAFYLCPEVVNACKERKWRYISVGAPNRCFKVKSQRYIQSPSINPTGMRDQVFLPAEGFGDCLIADGPSTLVGQMDQQRSAIPADRPARLTTETAG